MSRKGIAQSTKPLRELHVYARHRNIKPKYIPVPRAIKRSTLKSLSYQYTLERATCDGVTTTVFPPVIQSGLALKLTDSFSGVTNPYYRYQIAHGQNATTPAQGTSSQLAIGWSSYRVRTEYLDPVTKRTSWRDDSLYGYLNPFTQGQFNLNGAPSDVVTRVTNRVISKFLDKIDSARSSGAETGQDFGEYHQSLRSFLRPVDSLRRHVLGYFPSLKNRVRKARITDIPKVISETYLEWHFGWKPLAEDVADAYAAMTQNRHFDVVPISSTAHEDYSPHAETIINSYGSGPIAVMRNFDYHSRYSVRYKGAVATGARFNGSIPDLQLMQLDLPHFLPTVWDLIPYSFIADYFVNIGEFVRAYSIGDRNLNWGCKTVRNELVMRMSERIVPDTGQYLPYHVTAWVDNGCSYEWNSFTWSRAYLSSDDLVPRFQFKLPTSPWPYLNLGALLLSGGLPLQSTLQALLRKKG
jgi:hypothetical protein